MMLTSAKCDLNISRATCEEVRGFSRQNLCVIRRYVYTWSKAFSLHMQNCVYMYLLVISSTACFSLPKVQISRLF